MKWSFEMIDEFGRSSEFQNGAKGGDWRTRLIRSESHRLQMVSRIFQMALEEGILARNPCVGIQIKIPEVEQKVLTNSEAEIFLREAKLANHRFFPAWFMALKTGMRSISLTRD